MRSVASFFVEGRPRSKGSPQIGGKPGGKRYLRYDSDALREWTKIVKTHAAANRLAQPYAGPASLGLRFVMRRPLDHYRGGNREAGILKPDVPEYPIVRPDLSKLLRAVEDGLVPFILKDDSQVVHFHELVKIYGAREGVWVSVQTPEGT